jgi:predicted transcriptional regulator
MDDFLKEALEIVKAQARVQIMTEEDITTMVKKLSESLRAISASMESGAVAVEAGDLGLDPKKAIKEKSIICLACGKSFKVLTKRHLAQHSITPEEYRAKYGYKKGTPLLAKSLARDRRNKMKEMRLWEKRKKA